MAPGPKKRNFHTPRNPKNAQTSKNVETKVVDSTDETSKSLDVNSNLPVDSDLPQTDKYSKRSLENNWNKYEEPQVDPHADTLRGDDFNVLLSYSGGSGSQLKFQDEKEWDGEFTEELALDMKDLICSMKCIPFHERIGLKNVFDDTVLMNFLSSAKKHELAYMSQSNAAPSEPKVEEISLDPALNIIEESSVLESDEEEPTKNFSVQDETENMINYLASKLSFKTFSEKEEIEKIPEPPLLDEKKSETSNDLDFLLSLNISSNISAKEEKVTAKNTNVDDWLNSILDD